MIIVLSLELTFVKGILFEAKNMFASNVKFTGVNFQCFRMDRGILSNVTITNGILRDFPLVEATEIQAYGLCVYFIDTTSTIFRVRSQEDVVLNLTRLDVRYSTASELFILQTPNAEVKLDDFLVFNSTFLGSVANFLPFTHIQRYGICLR